MHIRRSPSGDGPTIYRPNESVAMRLDPPPRPVAHEPDSIPPPPRDSLLMRVNRRRGQLRNLVGGRDPVQDLKSRDPVGKAGVIQQHRLRITGGTRRVQHNGMSRRLGIPHHR